MVTNRIVSKEELENSGLSLRDFLNRERGLTRKPDVDVKFGVNVPRDQYAQSGKSTVDKQDAAAKLDALNAAYKPRSSVGGGRGGQGGPSVIMVAQPDDYTPRRDPNADARAALSSGNSDEAGNAMKRGGKVSSASSRADGIAQRGKTKGRYV
jgi:hypothetical protein